MMVMMMVNKHRAKIAKIRNKREKNFSLLYKAVSKVFTNFASTAKSSLTKTDLIDQIPWDDLSEELKSVILSVMESVTKDFSSFVNNLMSYGLEDNEINAINSSFIKKYRKDVAKNVTNITDSVRNSISKIISNGQDTGLTSNDIAQQIYDKFDTLSLSRAKIIARTEINSVTNNVHENVAQSAGMSKRTWIHTGAGKKSREHHRSLNNVSIKFNETFNVNGYKAKCPHDESLPISEKISCHCLAIYE